MKVSSPSRFEHCENDGLKNTIWFADREIIFQVQLDYNGSLYFNG